MKHLTGYIADRRPGYLRQQSEPETITCECGARVLEQRLPGKATELIHVGDCYKIQNTNINRPPNYHQSQ